MPPCNDTIRCTPVLFLRSSAREIDEMLGPCFQRSHSSAFCADVNQIRDVTMAISIQLGLDGVALTG